MDFSEAVPAYQTRLPPDGVDTDTDTDTGGRIGGQHANVRILPGEPGRDALACR